MSKVLDGEKDGIALAAPQIGAPLRIFIVSDKIFNFKKIKIIRLQSKNPKSSFYRMEKHTKT